MSDTSSGLKISHSLMIFFVIVCTIFLPAILAIWLLSLSIRTHYGGINVVTPMRWLLCTGLPILLAIRGLHKHSLSLSGAIAALFVGFTLTIANYCFMTSMIVFFLTSSKLTKFKADKKRVQEEDYKVGGSRNWIQVLCNGGFPSAMAILYMMDYGIGESPIKFSEHGFYVSSWLSVAVLGSISCACGDTWASEVGSVMGNGSTILVTTWKKVPPGTNGGITSVGTVASAFGGLIIGITYYLTMYLTCPVESQQWPIIFTGMISGLFGSFIDSLFGATLQYSGFNDITKKISNSPGQDVRWISGVNIMDNHAVNAITCFISGFTAPVIFRIICLVLT
ncbi:transmembrane protein 19-like [Styela clava]